MIHPAMVTMVTMAITLLRHVIQQIRTAVVTMVITLLRGVTQPIHTAVVTRRPTTHQLNLQSQHATLPIHIATLRSKQ